MQDAKILWVDDEIQLLKPQVMFLEQKGMAVAPVTNAEDALDRLRAEAFDIIFLDEHMPGMNGLEALGRIKEITPHTPVVMITKSEEENLMNEALGSQIADYLIKPVNPNQVLLAVKKLLEGRSLVQQKIQTGYQQDFRNIGMAFFDAQDHHSWAELYEKLVYWETELERSADRSMLPIYQEQKAEANQNFCRWVMEEYLDWVNGKPEDRPVMSFDLMDRWVLPLVKDAATRNGSVFFILVDCMRLDQWKTFESTLAQIFHISQQETYYSILPTATHYARNAIFAGLPPLEIAKRYPRYWVADDDNDTGKNLHESDFLQELISRRRLNIKHSYNKILTNEEGKALVDGVPNLLHNQLNAVVVNFLDMVVHARSEMNLIRELAPDEAALRSLSRSWLEHSTLLQLLRRLRQENVTIVITTDHGSLRVRRPLKIIGDRNTTTNLRYKQGRNLNYDQDSRQIFTVKRPEDALLPRTSASSSFAFAAEDTYFVYPNNYNHYVNHYRDTLQHGGLSLEEMVVPFIVLEPK